MNPIDDYLMTKEAGLMDAIRRVRAGGLGDTFRGAWSGISGGARPTAQAYRFGGRRWRLANELRGFEFGQAAQVPALKAGAITTVAVGALAASKIYDAIQRQRDFKEMMSVSPELAMDRTERPAFFDQAYNSLRRINPTFGSDPIIAGSYMKKMMANPDAAGLHLAQAIKAPNAPSGALQMQAKLGPLQLNV